VKVCGIQADLVWEDRLANRRALLPRIERAARQGARLIALPEMWPSGFSMDTARVAEDENGPADQFLLETAGRLGVTLCGSHARKDRWWDRPRNVFTLATPDGRMLRYTKIHTFRYGSEHEYYDAGDEAATWDIEGLQVTPLICYDLRFPELFAAVAASTDLFLVVANWPDRRAAHWKALLVARAIECQCYVLGVNRVGAGGGLHYTGDSLLVSPLGKVLASAPAGAEVDLIGQVDCEEVARVREDFGFLADRQPEVYRRIAKERQR